VVQMLLDPVAKDSKEKIKKRTNIGERNYLQKLSSLLAPIATVVLSNLTGQMMDVDDEFPPLIVREPVNNAIVKDHINQK
jgi:hypothetical protein